MKKKSIDLMNEIPRINGLPNDQEEPTSPLIDKLEKVNETL